MSVSKLLSGSLLIVVLAGCQGLMPGWMTPAMKAPSFKMPSLNPLKLRSQSPDEDIDDEFRTTIHTPFVGDYTTIAGLNLITIEGVGLVTGLDNTGEDPPPSMYRTALMEQMKKRGVKNPNMILRSPTTALVVVRAYLPPLIRKGDRFDVEVRLPGNSEATSLRGGTLLETYLSEKAIVPGRGELQGHIFAKAAGPILTSTGEGDDGQSHAGVLRNGRILGGGLSMKERHMTIYLRNDFRSVRNSKRIADRIGERFHSFDRHGIKEPLAEAKTDQTILLKIPENYRDNYPRYLQVIRNIAFRETDVLQRVRMQNLGRELLDAPKSERAALQLEALGLDGAQILKTGLNSPDAEVRFHSAVALAYLGIADGLPILAESARDERAFRVFALAAMSVIDDAEVHMQLRDLMSTQTDGNGREYDSAELRYGAFRALWTLDANDPFLRGEPMDGKFWLHVLETDGEPMIHLTHHKRPEVVIFGQEQQFHTPLVLRAGNHILATASPGSEFVTLSRYEAGADEQTIEVPLRVADVVRAVVHLGGSYPDVAQMLAQASNQHNLQGRIAIDALPQAGRVYYRRNSASPAQFADGAEKSTTIGRPSLVPNMFPNLFNQEEGKKKETLEKDDRPGESGSASLARAGSSAANEKGAGGFRWERLDLLHIFTDPEFVDAAPDDEPQRE